MKYLKALEKQNLDYIENLKVKLIEIDTKAEKELLGESLGEGEEKIRKLLIIHSKFLRIKI